MKENSNLSISVKTLGLETTYNGPDLDGDLVILEKHGKKIFKGLLVFMGIGYLAYQGINITVKYAEKKLGINIEEKSK